MRFFLSRICGKEKAGACRKNAYSSCGGGWGSLRGDAKIVAKVFFLGGGQVWFGDQGSTSAGRMDPSSEEKSTR
jgi:hypothetical protein